MVSAQNFIIRSLNRVYQLSPIIPSEDTADFLEFATLSGELLHHHHDLEETCVFPILSKHRPEETERNKAQHRALFVGLRAWQEYLVQAKTGKQPYDSNKLKKLMDAFGEVLVQHLNEERPTVTPEALSKYSEEDLQAIKAAMDKSIEETKATGATSFLPFAVFMCDLAVTPRFPPFPYAAVILGRYVFSWKHSAYILLLSESLTF